MHLVTAPPEPWVDTLTVAEHLGWGRSLVAKMADTGEIPSVAHRSGKRTYRRFKLSAVDAALTRQQPQNTQDSAA